MLLKKEMVYSAIPKIYRHAREIIRKNITIIKERENIE
jgi:hypothetical protein